VKGGQSQRREVRGAGGANGVECWEGCPLPTEEGVWGGGCAPSPEIKKIGSMCSKKFCVQAKGGHRPVAPLNTPLGGGQMAYVQIRRFSRRGSYDRQAGRAGCRHSGAFQALPSRSWCRLTPRRETTLTRTLQAVYGLR